MSSLFDYGSPRNFEDALTDFRAKTARDAGGVSTTPTRICSVCKKTKSTIGGSNKALLPGAVTRWNPRVFKCLECSDNSKS